VLPTAPPTWEWIRSGLCAVSDATIGMAQQGEERPHGGPSRRRGIARRAHRQRPIHEHTSVFCGNRNSCWPWRVQMLLGRSCRRREGCRLRVASRRSCGKARRPCCSRRREKRRRCPHSPLLKQVSGRLAGQRKYWRPPEPAELASLTKLVSASAPLPLDVTLSAMCRSSRASCRHEVHVERDPLGAPRPTAQAAFQEVAPRSLFGRRE